LICERATNPKMMANTPPTPNIHRSEHTSEAMARPFVLAAGT
jgi:hypothetical protein